MAEVTGGTPIEAEPESQLSSMEVSATSSDLVTVSSQRILMDVHVWAIGGSSYLSMTKN